MEVHILVPLAWKIEDETKGSKSENSQIHIMDKQWHHGRMVWWEIKGSKTTDLPNSTPSMNHVRGGQAARRSGATGKRTGASIEGRHALSLCQFLPKNWVFKIFYSTSDMTFWHIFQNAPKKQRVCCLVFRGFSPICWGWTPSAQPPLKPAPTSLHDSNRQYLHTYLRGEVESTGSLKI